MSEENTTPEEAKEASAETAAEETAEGSQEAAPAGPQELKLSGLFARKLGMATVYNDEGEAVPVTAVQFDTWKVTQIKTKEKDGYDSVQVAARPKSGRKSTTAQKGHLKKAGFASNATFVREVRGAAPDGCEIGQTVSINSLAKGDRVRLTSKSKGRGFAGAMKRHGFGGGPASHGSGTHRRPGSIGMCEFPGRVMKGKKMPGHFGDETVTLKHVEVVDVIPEENVLLLKGGVPGGRNTLVTLLKE